MSALAKDITEFLPTLDLPPRRARPASTVAYHSACSMQHGQQIKDGPKRLLARAGFTVKDVPEGHICCGSAGVYNILQPEIAGQLRERKVDNIEKTQAGHHRHRQYRLHDPDRAKACATAAAPRRSSTRWNCSTGRWAGRCRRRFGRRGSSTEAVAA